MEVVVFRIGEGDSVVIERMHAKGREDGFYVLDNSPFYAFDISCGDVFRASQLDGCLTFIEVVERGGHSTYRVKLSADRGHDYFLEHWGKLEREGCTYEGSSVAAVRLYSIDVPPEADVHKVYELLELGEKQNIWEFEEAHYFDREPASDSLPDAS